MVNEVEVVAAEDVLLNCASVNAVKVVAAEDVSLIRISVEGVDADDVLQLCASVV